MNLLDYFCEAALDELSNNFLSCEFQLEKSLLHLSQCEKCRNGFQSFMQDIVLTATNNMMQKGLKGKVEAMAFNQLLNGLMKGLPNAGQ